MIRRAKDEEKCEDEDVKLAFPDFRRPQGLAAVGMEGERRLGIEDAERGAGWCAEGIAVQKIGRAAERLSEDDGRRYDVGERPRVDAVTARVEDADDGAEQHAALDRHAALPDVQKLRQVVLVVIPIEEEDVPEPCA